LEHRIKYMVSADFGQTTDYTAEAVTQRRLVPTSGKYTATDRRMTGDLYNPEYASYQVTRQDVAQHYDLIRLDRVQLHTPYTKIARGIVKLLGELYHLHVREDALRPAQPVDVGLAIDEGGVGKAVKDILLDAIETTSLPDSLHVIFLPVTVHGGANTTASGGFYHVPKRDLVHAGIVAYQNRTLHVAKLRYRSVLEEELKNYRLKQNLATGYAGFEPLREGQHDDLLFATCLGVWAWERAIERTEYLSFPGEWALEGVPVNVVGEGR
jgi:hypothetical protein